MCVCRAFVIYFTSISVSDYTASMMELLHDELGKDLSWSNPGTIPGIYLEDQRKIRGTRPRFKPGTFRIQT